MTGELAHVRPEPIEAPEPSINRDPLRDAAILAAFDTAVDAHEHLMSLAAVELICRSYHAHLKALGGRL